MYVTIDSMFSPTFSNKQFSFISTSYDSMCVRFMGSKLSFIFSFFGGGWWGVYLLGTTTKMDMPLFLLTFPTKNLTKIRPSVKLLEQMLSHVVCNALLYTETALTSHVKSPQASLLRMYYTNLEMHWTG